MQGRPCSLNSLCTMQKNRPKINFHGQKTARMWVNVCIQLCSYNNVLYMIYVAVKNVPVSSGNPQGDTFLKINLPNSAYVIIICVKLSK